MHTLTKLVDEYYFSAKQTREDYDEYSYGLSQPPDGKAYFWFKARRRPDSQEPIAKELVFGGPDAAVAILDDRADKLERIDATAVRHEFALKLSAQNGATVRHINGSDGTNVIDLGQDYKAWNAIKLGDSNDVIQLGPKGGQVFAGKGRNFIFADRGRDEIIIAAADDSTCTSASDSNLTTVRYFQQSQDKLRLLFETKGWVSDDVQERIDQALSVLPAGTSLCGRYNAAKDIRGVDEGHVFRFRHGYHDYIGVDNQACTLIDLEPGVAFFSGPPSNTDVLFL
ncbi:hypothetical protein ACFQU1_17025 [Chelatococcus sp. GCM10030263]|uniref:hypothetical protein n=1 Tax=Chelatococcus sp. GCM10030263 TaxID=3273387 RepID=UPI00360622CC